MSGPCRVAIYLFDNVEVLDFAGPYEVFTTATRVRQRQDAAAPPAFEVFTVSHRSTTVRARAGLSVQSDYLFGAHPPVDLLIIPGGVVTAELDNTDMRDWLQRTAAQAEITASVCTGAFLLAQAGLLQGRSVTTHWEDIDDLRRAFPGLAVQAERRWVDEGRIVTSAGISAGIDMSLHLVERIAGRALAERTARQLEFDWTENA